MASEETPETSISTRRLNIDVPKVCGNCQTPGDQNRRLLKCASCQLIWYCSRECQRAQWKKHKPTCLATKLVLSAHAQPEYDPDMFVKAVQSWLQRSRMVIGLMAKNVLLPNRDLPNNYRIDTHALVISLELLSGESTDLRVGDAFVVDFETLDRTYEANGLKDVPKNTMKKRAAEIPDIEKEVKMKVGSMWYMVYFGPFINLLHPITVTEAEVESHRQSDYKENWLEILKATTLPGCKPYIKPSGQLVSGLDE